MDKHEHDYRKLNDSALFCRGCGDIKSVQQPVCTLPHFPTYWWWQVTPWWVTTTTGQITVGGTTTYEADNVTYTVESRS